MKKSSSKKNGSSGRLTTMVNKSSLKDHTLVATRFMTKMAASLQVFLPASSSLNIADNVFGNSIFQPFNSPNPLNTSMTLITGNSITYNPAGYTALSTLYKYYRVRSSRIKVTLQPASTDIVNLVVYPSPNSNPTTVGQIEMSTMYSKHKTCSSSNNVKENTIISYASSNVILGLTKQQYDDQLPIAVTAQPAASLDWFWNVAYTVSQTNTGTNAGAIAMIVELDMYVEFSDPILQTN